MLNPLNQKLEAILASANIPSEDDILYVNKTLPDESQKLKEFIASTLYKLIVKKSWSGIKRYCPNFLKINLLKGATFPSKLVSSFNAGSSNTSALMLQATENGAPFDIVLLFLKNGFTHHLIPQQDLSADERSQENNAVLTEHIEFQEVLNRYTISEYTPGKGLLSEDDCIFLCQFNLKYGNVSTYIDLKAVMRSIFIKLHENPKALQAFINECAQYLDFEGYLFAFFNQSYGYSLEGLVRENLADDIGENKAGLINLLVSGQKIQTWVSEHHKTLTEVENCILYEITAFYCNANPKELGGSRSRRDELLQKIRGLDSNADTKSLLDFFSTEMNADYIGSSDRIVLRAFFNGARAAADLQDLVIGLLDKEYYRINAKTLISIAMKSSKYNKSTHPLEALLDQAKQGVTYKISVIQAKQCQHDCEQLDVRASNERTNLNHVLEKKTDQKSAIADYKKALANLLNKFCTNRLLAAKNCKLPKYPLQLYYYSPERLEGYIKLLENSPLPKGQNSKLLEDAYKHVHVQDYEIVGVFICLGFKSEQLYKDLRAYFDKPGNLNALHKWTTFQVDIYRKYRISERKFELHLEDIWEALGEEKFAKVIDCRNEGGETLQEVYEGKLSGAASEAKDEFASRIKLLKSYQDKLAEKAGPKAEPESNKSAAKPIKEESSNPMPSGIDNYRIKQLSFLLNTVGSAAILWQCRQWGMESTWGKMLTCCAYIYMTNIPAASCRNVPLIPIVSTVYSIYSSCYSPVGFAYNAKNIALGMATAVITSTIFFAKHFKSGNEQLDGSLKRIDNITDAVYPSFLGK